MSPESIPQCIGIIMDGNRRWARERSFPLFEGHRRGAEKLKEVLRWAKELGVLHLIAFAFSVENWNRAKEEVGYLMDLLRHFLVREIESIKKEGGRIRCIGERERFTPDLQRVMERAERETENNAGPVLALALSYGGRAEIVHTTNAALAAGERSFTEDSFRQYLWTRDMPDPDMIIRTGGEMRLSGFLPWQSVYSELFFTKTLWPDFSKEEFLALLEDFSKRKRNFGR